MSAAHCACCSWSACLAPVPSGAREVDWPERLRASQPVICPRSRERGVVVSIDDHRGKALVAFRRSTVVRALCDLARPGDA